jgi:hypothetical protein
MLIDALARQREAGPARIGRAGGSRSGWRRRRYHGAIVALCLGFRHDLDDAMHGFTFWMKWTYTISLAIGAIWTTAQLARPEERSLRGLWLMAIPVVLLAGVGVGELMRTPQTEWLAMWLGHSWRVCPWLVLTLSMPIFAGLLWSFRRLAPTRLRAAGAAAGLAAGAFGATVYCLHCPEVSAIFVLTWYSLGILLPHRSARCSARACCAGKIFTRCNRNRATGPNWRGQSGTS